MVKKKQKIVVGISGGVDSSVVAYLLKQQGHDVHGVFVKTWSPEWLPCTWIDEKRDAMRVCASLDIPFHFLDAEQAYKDGVAEYMINEYRAGRTPNPDVLCNRVIKFGVLWEYAQSLGADAVATGHYARVVSSNQVVDSSKTQHLPTTSCQLLTGLDPAKDQSYFLWMLSKEELAHVQFPIGHLPKSEVRTLAAEAKLFTSTKKDSQGICFLGDVDMRAFLSHYIEQKEGEVVDEKGVVLGTHTGVWFHTLGERHGFTITAKTSDDRPYYVIGKDIEHNRVIVSHTPKSHTVVSGVQTLKLRDVNWIEPIDPTKKYSAQIRYHGALIEAHVVNDREVKLVYDGLIALGQSLVIYDKDTLVGGGIIDEVR